MKSARISGYSTRTLHRANKAGWDAAANGGYTTGLAQHAECLREGHSSLTDTEEHLLRPLAERGPRALHLQCADGRDTLSLRLFGCTQVAGLDIAPAMIRLATQMSELSGIPATWVCADVIDAPLELRQPFDLVYTGKGALMWMHDIALWARTVTELLAEGGSLVLYDLHPAVALFRQDTNDLSPSGIDYFDFVNATRGWPTGYIGDLDEPDRTLKFERLWTLGEIVSAVCDAGLIVESLHEYPDAYWDAFPALTDDQRATLPKTFSLVASKSRH